MKSSQHRQLKGRGYRVETVRSFLSLSAAETRLLDLKVLLIERLKKVRKANKVTQATLARLIESSQSRVAKMEAGSTDVSLDLICRSLFVLGDKISLQEK